MKILGIDHVQLAIPPGGEAKARAFYGDVLGLTEVPKPEGMRARGGMWFSFRQRPSGAEAPAGPRPAARGGERDPFGESPEGFDGGIHLGIEDGMRPSQKMHPALKVADLDAWKQRLVAAGCEWKDADDLPGVRRGHTKDPFGNRIELVEV